MYEKETRTELNYQKFIIIQKQNEQSLYSLHYGLLAGEGTHSEWKKWWNIAENAVAFDDDYKKEGSRKPLAWAR